ncbi:MAG: tetratricopeptide repeat protein [Halopseudomonas sp.]
MATAGTQVRSSKRLPRALVLLVAVLLILGLGLVIRQLPGDWTLTTAQKESFNRPAEGRENEQEGALKAPLFDSQQWRLDANIGDQNRRQAQRLQQIRVLFEHGANLMRQGKYPQARKALEMVVELAPVLPEGYVNLGFVLYEMGEVEAAINAFNYASQLNPYQSNAYYGAALGYERLADYEVAMGHMRSFIHLSEPENPFLPKARAALWEWEQTLASLRQAQVPANGGPDSANKAVIKPSDVSEGVPGAQK